MHKIPTSADQSGPSPIVRRTTQESQVIKKTPCMTPPVLCHPHALRPFIKGVTFSLQPGM